jgi:hypothetical protein
MKTNKILSTAGFSFLLLSSVLLTNCKKDEKEPEPTPAPVVLTNTQKLTGKNFKMTALTVNPGINIGFAVLTDLYAQFEACDKDDLLTFNTNGTYADDEGGSKCDPADPQTTTGTWVWSTNETVLTITETGSTPSSITIVTNDGTTLKGTYSEVIDSITYVFTVTYTKQ